MSEFNAVLEENELQEGAMRVVEVEGVPVLVSRSEGGDTCAVANTCTHRGGPLNEGERDGDVVTCPWHGSQFDLCSRKVLRDLPETPAMLGELGACREARGTHGVLDQADGYDVATVALALAARTAAERVAVS